MLQVIISKPFKQGLFQMPFYKTYGWIFLIMLLGSTYSCRTQNTLSEHQTCQKIYPEYAKGFSINHYADHTGIVVYLDFEHPDSIEVMLPDTISRIACLSSTHLASLDALGMNAALCAFSSKKYMYAPEKYSKDLIEIGEPHELNYEKIKEANPSIVVLFGIDQKINQTIERLHNMHIPAILNLEYREEHPLAQAEWIKFFGVMLHQEKKADSLFQAVKERYLTLKEQVRKTTSPSVMLNIPWRGRWYISGNNTLIAAYIRDAGGDYLFKDLPIAGTKPMSYEEVFKKANHAHIWLHPGIAQTKNDMLQMDPHADQFEAFQKGQIFNNNKRVNKNGCNDFFESATTRPDIVLSDLIKIFQQDTNNLYFYQKIY